MKKAILFFFCLLFIVCNAYSQMVVSGKVTDNIGSPVQGASIRIKGSGKGAISAADGSYRLAANTIGTLEISMIGYASQTIEVGDRSVIDIKLELQFSELGQIVFLATRRLGRVKTETPVPVDVVNMAQAILPTGRMDITSVLNYAAPSFNYNKQSGSDGADHVDLATLRGLGPDQTLVLINGKRRHQTSFVAVFGTRGRGNSGTDLNAIPGSAIDRVEILRDGASAQYGSDAIAGVINLILKKSVNKVSGSIGFSGYHDPKFNTAYASDLLTQYISDKKIDGKSFSGNINFGIPLGKKGGFFNATIEGLTTEKTFRQALDTSNYYTNDEAMYINIYRRAHGDASLDAVGTFVNLELPTEGRTTFYSFGGINHKSSDAYAFTRNFSARPDRFPTDANGNLIFVPSIMKNTNDGETFFNPHIQTKINDYAATAGLRGIIWTNWNWDLSNTFGRNKVHFFGDKTFNASQGAAQTHFDDGGFSFNQNTINLGLSKELSSRINLGVGAEYRHENYKIFSGEPGSYTNYDPTGDKATGSQGFPGYQPNDVVDANRSVFGAYGDLEFDWTPTFLVNWAVRLEDYSDFGFTHNYKFATRFKAARNINLRGSVSTGFRAPSLQQINFSSTFTTVQAGTIAEVKIAPNYSSLAKTAGIPDLKQERSLSASIGLTWKANTFLNITIDGYLTKIKDRVVLSGQFDGSDPDLDPSLRSQMAALNVALAQFFANAVNTTNKGIDVVIEYNRTFGDNKFRGLFTGNFQSMDITKINVPPKLSGSNFLRQTFLSDREQKFILASAPNTKFAFNLEYSIKKLGLGSRLTYFGEVVLLGYGQDGLGINPTVPLDNGTGDVPDRFNYGGKFVTDLNLNYAISKKFTIYLGVDNVLNTHPDFGVVKGAKDWAYNTETGGAWDAVQMGSNGRRLFARLAFNFGQ